MVYSRRREAVVLLVLCISEVRWAPVEPAALRYKRKKLLRKFRVVEKAMKVRPGDPTANDSIGCSVLLPNERIDRFDRLGSAHVDLVSGNGRTEPVESVDPL